MSKKSDKPKVQDDSVAPKLELYEIPGFIFAFFWFYKGVWIAIAIVWGLFQVLNHSSDSVSKTRQRDQLIESTTFTTIAEPYIERSPPEVQYSASDTEADSGQPLGKQAAVPLPRRKRKPLSESADEVRFRELLSDSTPDALIKISKGLKRNSANLNSIEAVSRASRRRRVSQRLRELDLDEQQAIYADVAELEALSSLDALNRQFGLDLDNARSNLTEYAIRFQDHPQPDVSAKANLAILAAAGVDLLSEQTEEFHQRFNAEYHQRVDAVLQTRPTADVIAQLLVRYIETDRSNEHFAQLFLDFVQRTRSHSLAEIQQMGAMLNERWAFGDLDLQTLITRMDYANQTTASDIDRFFSQLAQNPDSRPVLFKIALAVIGKFQMQNDFEASRTLIERLRETQPAIASAEAKHFVTEALNQYEQKLTSPVSTE